LRAIRVAAATAAVLTYALIVLGALVRSTNSGLSCPDWPTCYGQWVLTPADFAALPETGYTYAQVMLEWVHRLIAGVFLGPLILLLAVLVWPRRRERPVLARAAAVLVALLLVQGALGGVTVLDRNSPWSVALHLGNALLVLTTVLFLFVRAGQGAAERVGGSRLVARTAAAAWGAGAAGDGERRHDREERRVARLLDMAAVRRRARARRSTTRSCGSTSRTASSPPRPRWPCWRWRPWRGARATGATRWRRWRW
jgi:cytochrome c oxidase assembly protein subunit 15